jgi:hypothetical protein
MFLMYAKAWFLVPVQFLMRAIVTATSSPYKYRPAVNIFNRTFAKAVTLVRS